MAWWTTKTGQNGLKFFFVSKLTPYNGINHLLKKYNNFFIFGQFWDTLAAALDRALWSRSFFSLSAHCAPCSVRSWPPCQISSIYIQISEKFHKLMEFDSNPRMLGILNWKCKKREQDGRSDGQRELVSSDTSVFSRWAKNKFQIVCQNFQHLFRWWRH